MSYKAQPYDPSRHMGPDYHPSWEYRYKAEMRERFPENLVEPLPLAERGPMPFTMPDHDIREHRALCECEGCRAPYTAELKTRWTRTQTRAQQPRRVQMRKGSSLP